MQGPIIISMADGSPIFKGSRRKVKATFTDKNGAGATPTDATLTFIPPSGSANEVEYAKNPTGSQIAFDSFVDNVGEVDFLFNEAGTWKIVGVGATNMDETEYVQVLIEDVP